ncbi:MAG: DUF1772 domain-containing protein [Propioniciclava sp.]
MSTATTKAATLAHVRITPAAAMTWLGVIFAGAIFGFFYAWVCSTMWGLDATDPRVAIQAMQAMNASVRNPVFFPAFFLTPVVLGFAAVLAWFERRLTSAWLLAAAGLLYLGGALMVTATINVPMNEALALVQIPADDAAARQIWTDYSSAWQIWNTIRTVVSGVGLGLAGAALIALPRVRRS